MITRVICPAPAGVAEDTGSRASRMSGAGTAEPRPRPPAQDNVAPAPGSFLPAGVERIFIPAAGERGYSLTVAQDPDPSHQLTMDELRAELVKMPWLRKWFARKMLELYQEQAPARPDPTARLRSR
jgi:hypothetical protein